MGGPVPAVAAGVVPGSRVVPRPSANRSYAVMGGVPVEIIEAQHSLVCHIVGRLIMKTLSLHSTDQV